MVIYGLVSPRIHACNLTLAIHFRCKSGKFDQNRLWITGKRKRKLFYSIHLETILWYFGFFDMKALWEILFKEINMSITSIDFFYPSYFILV